MTGSALQIWTMRANGWKLPLNISVAIHLLVVLGALYLPGFFKAKPKFADIYTVSLINVAEPVLAPPSSRPQPPTPTPKAQDQPPPPPAPPKVEKKAIPVTETPPEKVEQPSPPAAPAKAISLKPLKQKVVKEVKEPEPAPKKDDQTLKKVQKLAEAIREEAILNERARLAQEALEQERRVLAQSAKGRITTSENAPPATPGAIESNGPVVSGSSNNLIESQYQAAIASRLQQFWSLPEHLQKDPNLTAIVAITIKLDGDIANVVFESRSGDRIFDQFVSKAIEEATPLPPIPPALKKQRYEIGFRFKPGSIQ